MNFDVALFCFFNSWWVCSFPMHGLPLCLWVVLENLSLIAGTVITLSKNLGFSSVCFEMSAQTSWRFSFWSLVTSFDTTYAPEVESSRTSLASRTHFEVLGLGLEGQVLGLGLETSSPRKLACPRLEDSSIFWNVKILWSAWKIVWKTFFRGDRVKNFWEDLFFFFFLEIAWKILVKTFFFFFFFGEHLRFVSLVLGLGLEHSCPWPRECLSSERLSLALALASDFFCVFGLGLEPCVLDSTSVMHKLLSHADCHAVGYNLPHCFFVNRHPLCYQSNTKPTIFSDNFFNFSVIVSGFWYGWASWTFIIFNISPAFMKSFVPFKNTGSWHAFFVVNFHQSLNFTKNFKLILCSVLELNIFLRLQQNFLQQWAICCFCKPRFFPTRKKTCTCFQRQGT